jgi:phosphatidylserine/phosphatidylglycerophosphate/cardiolipin synthase-like enzyme
MFPYAYHIKVIVRDNNTFWLSSGNLNPPRTQDRDWHVIIQDSGLAQTFAAFLNYDYQSAARNQASNPTAIEKTIEDAHAKRAAEANPPSPRPQAAARPAKAVAQPVAAKVFDNITLDVTPLLTPDKVPGSTTEGQYLSNIMGLIASAKSKLYIHLQYIESSDGQGDPYDTLLKAIAGKVAAGVDVKLIESAQYGLKWAEKMKAAGVDLTANIRLQPDVHNKGFVVDSKTVVVSSQNFSPPGVTDNRDAGVILASAEIAQYFEPIFLADWNNKSKPVVAQAGARPAKPGAAKKAAKPPAKRGTQRSTKAVRKAPTKKTPSSKTPSKTRRRARP